MRISRLRACVMNASRRAIAVAFEAGLFGERDLFGVEVDERTACVRGKRADHRHDQQFLRAKRAGQRLDVHAGLLGRCGDEPLFPY